MIRPLSSGYSAEVGTIADDRWFEITQTFADANLYQVWQSGVAPRAFPGVGRLVLLKDGTAVAAAEVRLFTLPRTSVGIAYLRWGPMWRRRGAETDPEHFRQALRALRNEYVGKRGMILRLNPRLFVEEHAACERILAEEGFSERGSSSQAEKTLVMDLSPSLEELRAGLDKKWRNCLSKAERGGLTVTIGTGPELFREFGGIYSQMLERKQFAPTADFDAHVRLQGLLPESAKMTVIIARADGEPCAGAICSAMNDTALYLFGATNDAGMRTCGSYLVQWEAVKLLRQRGVREYDLHGINVVANPGTYTFKKGLAGRDGREVTFVGQRQALTPSLVSSFLLLGEKARTALRSARDGHWRTLAGTWLASPNPPRA
jgi:GNAT acetyltransferase-like protein